MRSAAAIALLLGAGLPGLAQPAGSSRIVAIGDIHGAYTEFTAVLKRAGLVDERLRWSGGRTTFVQTGDYTDRGAGVRQVLDLLMRLEREARAAGGRAVILLGNHETMNLIGDWRDVTPEICAAFATPRSERRRQDAWKRYERLQQAQAARPAPALVYQQSQAEWMAAHPPGCLEYQEAMSPSGAYGRWLRDKPIAARVGATLFMHAGLNPSRPAPRSIDQVNERARDEIRRMDAYRRRLADRDLALPSFTLREIFDVSLAELRDATSALAAAKAENKQPPAFDVPTLREAQAMLDIGEWSLVDPEGPMWFRGYALWDEASSSAQVLAFMDQLKLARIVVGHTVTTDWKITTRFGGRVVLMDTGMLTAVYKGRPAALEITGKTMKAIYLDGEEALTSSPATPGRSVRSRWPRQSSHLSDSARAARPEWAADNRTP